MEEENAMKKWFKSVIADWKWWLDVRRNRRRHPDLTKREQDGEKPVLIAQEMMMRDRETFRIKNNRQAGVGYPTLHDYLYRKPIRHRWRFQWPSGFFDIHPDIHS